jgi:hypothetical protein
MRRSEPASLPAHFGELFPSNSRCIPPPKDSAHGKEKIKPGKWNESILWEVDETSFDEKRNCIDHG